MGLVLSGGLFYLTLLGTTLFKTVEEQTEYLDYFSRNIKSFGSSFICVVREIEETRKIHLKLARQLNTTYFWVVEFVFILVTVCTCECWAWLSS